MCELIVKLIKGILLDDLYINIIIMKGHESG